MPRAALTTPRSAALLDWYAQHRRDLPWRDETDPYRVLVSEVMLQQTQAGRVVGYYQRFVERFPTVESLAAAPLADVLAAWQGLGYNRRVTRLQEAARTVAERGWPRDAVALQELPGVGPYTAAAVACFAFGQPIAAPDTNARRVLSRWHGRPLSGSDLRDVASAEVPPAASEWNQAVMDLGASVCLPTAPGCDVCPVATWCVDPSVYQPPRPQGRFKGSAREARGAVIRHLVDHRAATVKQIAAVEHLSETRLDEAVAALIEEGLVVTSEGGRLHLPGT